MTCKDCDNKLFSAKNGGPNRYYCKHPKAEAGIGSRMICRTARGSAKMPTKTAPHWCPLRGDNN